MRPDRHQASADHELLSEICDIMTRFEVAYQQYPTLEFINVEIIKALDLIRGTVLIAAKKPNILTKNALRFLKRFDLL